MAFAYRLYEGTVSTTDATKTVGLSVTQADATVTHVVAVVVGRKSDGTQGFSAELHGTFRRAGAVTTQIGTTTAVHMKSDDAAWTAGYNVSAAAFTVEVTGNVGDSVAWRVWVITYEDPSI